MTIPSLATLATAMAAGDEASRRMGAQPPSNIEIKLDFLQPIASQNSTVFALQPQGEGTRAACPVPAPL